MQTVGGADGYASVPRSVPSVALAAVFDRASFHYVLFLVNLLELDLVFGTSWWEVEAPDEFSHLIRLIFCHCNFNSVCFLSSTYVGSFQISKNAKN